MSSGTPEPPVPPPGRHSHPELHGAFGSDGFGQLAEGAARFFGTPQYIVGQTLAVLAWVAVNSTQLHLGFAWDIYPFIALNLLFSLQAAYAAPLILLAQTRQADRDRVTEEASARHRQEIADTQTKLLEENTALTREVHTLSEAIAKHIAAGTRDSDR